MEQRMLCFFLMCLSACMLPAVFGEDEPVVNKEKNSEVKEKPKDPEITDTYIDSLIDKLESDDELERETATKKLGTIGKRAVPRIIGYGLKTKYHPVVRTNCIRVLGSIHTNESIEALTKELKSRIAEVVSAAIEAISRHGNEQVMSQKIFPLIHSENDVVRRKAILALGKYGFKSSVPGLCSLLKDDFEHIRLQALRELKNYPEMKDMIIQNVTPLLQNNNPDEALEAAVILQRFGDPRGDEFFRDHIIKKSRQFQEKAVAYIARYRISSGVPFMIKMLKDTQWYMRYIAVDALGELCDPLALPSLKVLFEEEKVKPVRLAVARVLYAYKHPDTASFLTGKVEAEKNENIRWFIVAALGAIGSDEVIGALITALQDSNQKIRIVAVTGLREITHKNFGYKPDEKPGERAAAVQEWRLWHRKYRKQKESNT